MQSFIEWLFDFKSKRQIPRSMAILTIACMACVFVPENMWNALGVDVNKNWLDIPEFLQRNLKDMESKNAAYVFWVLSPFVALFNFVIFAIRHNTSGYLAYLTRRANILAGKNKPKNSWRWPLIIQILIFVFIILFIPFMRGEPMIFGDFVVSKNRFALILIYGTALLYVIPIALTVLVTEVRAGLSGDNFDGKMK